ncbi:alkaline phosphatase PhoX [Salinisphaera sp. S4-8]|uniref:alkaline phosphatase PhoX n=1 Tax=Salinisphaera sp. S4-8 TaxID=633357 RepID=UPI003342A0D3
MVKRSAPRAHDPVRRRLLLQSLSGAGLLVTGSLLSGCNDGDASVSLSSGQGSGGGGTVRPGMPDGGDSTGSPISRLGALGAADENGVRLPPGFVSRVVATAGQRPYAGSPYLWHTYPDGGATFRMDDGGWVYVSNSEFVPGGVGALRFDANGEIVDAYAIQIGTILNCAGGPTPWGPWLTCEEYEAGSVYECDPTGAGATDALSNKKPALGTFNHEAATIDPNAGIVYMTEDDPQGGFYRFVCDAYPSLDSGTLQIAELVGDDPMTRRAIVWHDVPQPNPPTALLTEVENLAGELGELPLVGGLIDAVVNTAFTIIPGNTPTRQQVEQASVFDGGEGIWYHDGIVFFTTKGDNRVWAYDTADGFIEIIYDDALFDEPVLTGVDNVTISPLGDILVAEDGGDMQIVAITAERDILPLVQVVNQPDSEITGPAFSPDGSRLYFSSQRGRRNVDGDDSDGGFGITYEIRGIDGQRFFDPQTST